MTLLRSLERIQELNQRLMFCAILTSMDPYLDDEDPATVREWYQNTFMEHYNGNRQPFGLYNHPIHCKSCFIYKAFLSLHRIFSN